MARNDDGIIYIHDYHAFASFHIFQQLAHRIPRIINLLIKFITSANYAASL